VTPLERRRRAQTAACSRHSFQKTYEMRRIAFALHTGSQAPQSVQSSPISKDASVFFAITAMGQASTHSPNFLH